MNVHTGILSSGRRAILVGILTAVVLVITSGAIGLTWDEPTYIAASESYNGWFHRLVFGPHGVLNRNVVDSAWSINVEHPPFDKIVTGLVWGVTKNIFEDLFAHRLGNILLVSLTVALLYHMVSDEMGGVAGIAAAGSLLAMPRFFFHAHLAALDVPAACMIVIVTYVFWRTKESARIRYTIGLGLVWGLAVATRINALLIMPTLFLWVLIFRRRLYLIVRLVAATVLGLPVLVFLWPWLYYDTADRVKDFLKVVVSWPIPEYYLHQNLMQLPWHFAFVMTAAVIPLGIAVLCLIGVARSVLRHRDRAFGILMAICALVPLLVVVSGQTKVYDNDRMLMPAFPFLAALAGIGFGWVAKILNAAVIRFGIPRLASPLLSAGAACLVFIPVFLDMGLYAPYWLSYYSEAVGGLPGAQQLGFETTYWSESYREAIDYINEHAKPGDSVWVLPSSVDVMVYYQQQGVLRGDVVLASKNPIETIFGPSAVGSQTREDFSQADFVVVQHRESFLYDESGQPTPLLDWISSRTPVFRIERFGTPLLDVYTNP
jgi:4-amino-4-deoxy-L-arabinose transferase-like glycosyltransferase